MKRMSERSQSCSKSTKSSGVHLQRQELHEVAGRLRVRPDRGRRHVVGQLGAGFDVRERAAQRAGQRFAVHQQAAPFGRRHLLGGQLARHPGYVQRCLGLVFGVSVTVCDCCLFLLRMTDDVSDDHTHTQRRSKAAQRKRF